MKTQQLLIIGGLGVGVYLLLTAHKNSVQVSANATKQSTQSLVVQQGLKALIPAAISYFSAPKNVAQSDAPLWPSLADQNQSYDPFTRGISSWAGDAGYEAPINVEDTPSAFADYDWSGGSYDAYA